MRAEQSASLYAAVQYILLLPWASKLITELCKSKHFELFKSLLSLSDIYRWKKWINGLTCFSPGFAPSLPPQKNITPSPPSLASSSQYDRHHMNHNAVAFEEITIFPIPYWTVFDGGCLLLAILGLRLCCRIRDCLFFCACLSICKGPMRDMNRAFVHPKEPTLQSWVCPGKCLGGLWKGDWSPSQTKAWRKSHNQYPAGCLQWQYIRTVGVKTWIYKGGHSFSDKGRDAKPSGRCILTDFNHPSVGQHDVCFRFMSAAETSVHKGRKHAVFTPWWMPPQICMNVSIRLCENRWRNTASWVCCGW